MLPEQRQQAIYQQLQEALNPLYLEVLDESHLHAGHVGHQGAGHFAITIVAACFTDKPLLARHRLVYASLENLIGSEIHALRINAKTPAED